AMIFGWDVYFLTSRPGMCAKFQTECWLFGQGMKIPYIPTVLILNHGKADVVTALKLDAMIDDRPDNLMNLPSTCRKFLFKRPYNEQWYDEEGYRDTTRVTSVTEMLKIIAKDTSVGLL